MTTIATLRTLLIAALLALAAGVGLARAEDRIVLSDGTELVGTIDKEMDGYIWFTYTKAGIQTQGFFGPGDYTSIVRDAAAPAPARADDDAARAPAPGSTQRQPRAAEPAGSGAPRAAIISLGEGGDKDMVGIFITAQKLRELVPILEEDNIDIVVFRVNSGGGMLLELSRLHDVIEEEYKPRFRTVAWIESAISAAAMTSHIIEEIYFMKRANYGASTGWFGQLTAVKGRDLEEVLYMMERVSQKGGYDYRIMRAMQINEPLSATRNADGTWEFFLDTSGEVLLNPADDILTLDSRQAELIEFSKGTTDDYRELGRLMGYQEIEWVGDTVPGVPYPVSRAEAEMRKFRDQTKSDQDRTNVFFDRYNRAIAAAQGAPPAERGRFISQARSALRDMERMVANNPNFALVTFNLEDYDAFRRWVREQEDMLAELARR